MKILLFPGNSKSSIVGFFRYFLMIQTWWQSFHLVNVTITVSVVLRTQLPTPIWLGEDRTVGMRSCFCILSSESPVYVAILQLSKSY